MGDSGFSLRSTPHGQPDACVPGRDPGRPGDRRVDRTKLHPLTDILVLSVLTVIRGTDSFVAIALFGQLNEEWLRTFLALPHGIPSHDTLGRVLARLDASGFQEGFRDWVQEAFELTEVQVVPVEGQGVRGSHDRGRGLGPCIRCVPGPSQPLGPGPDGDGRQVQRKHGHPGAAAHVVPEGLHRDHEGLAGGSGAGAATVRLELDPGRSDGPGQ